jgi:hypothetical protein
MRREGGALMRTFVHVPAFVLAVLTLISWEGLFATNQANAQTLSCCMCYSRCNAQCICPGTSLACPTCFGPGNIIINASREIVPAMVINSDSIDRLIRLAGGRQCPQNNSRLKLFDTQEMLKFDAAFLNNNRIEDKVVALQMTTGNEK